MRVLLIGVGTVGEGEAEGQQAEETGERFHADSGFVGIIQTR